MVEEKVWAESYIDQEDYVEQKVEESIKIV